MSGLKAATRPRKRPILSNNAGNISVSRRGKRNHSCEPIYLFSVRFGAARGHWIIGTLATDHAESTPHRGGILFNEVAVATSLAEYFLLLSLSRPLAPQLQKFGTVRHFHRTGDQVPLHKIAAQVSEQLQLLAGFNALCDHAQLQAVG